MYQTLIFFHSLIRWLVLGSLIYAIFRAYTGYSASRVFSSTDNAVRHWTATIAHIQLLLGAALYFNSPVIRSFFTHFRDSIHSINAAFFGVIHILIMFTAIITITIGSSVAKRSVSDQEKFRKMLVWFSIGLALIFLAIPWPFSPLANRPYFRSF